MSLTNTHLKHLFSERVQDFCFLRQESIQGLEEINQHFAQCHEKGFDRELKDPGEQYLVNCSPIGSPRIVPIGNQKRSRLFLDQLEEKRREAQIRKLPSPSSNINEQKLYSVS